MSDNNLPDGRFCIAYTYYNVNEPEKISCFCWAGHGSESLKEAKEKAVKMRQGRYFQCGELRLKEILLGQVILQRHSERDVEDLVNGDNPQGCYGFGKVRICQEYVGTLLYQNPRLEVTQSLHEWMLEIVSFDQDLRKRGNTLHDLYPDWFILKPIERFDVEVPALSLKASESKALPRKFVCFASMLLAA